MIDRKKEKVKIPISYLDSEIYKKIQCKPMSTANAMFFIFSLQNKKPFIKEVKNDYVTLQYQFPFHEEFFQNHAKKTPYLRKGLKKLMEIGVLIKFALMSKQNVISISIDHSFYFGYLSNLFRLRGELR